MKLFCTSCEGSAATVLCSADETVLCPACDSRQHRNSNKQRVGLTECKQEDRPKCDICQDGTAFVFCREDRAVLCRRCDFSIHTANKLAERHERFLLPGVLVALHPTQGAEETDSAPPESQRPGMAVSEEGEGPCSSKSSEGPVVPDVNNNVTQSHNQRQGKGTVNGRGSMDFKGKGFDQLPQWRVDELLDIPGLADGYNILDIDAMAGDLGDMDYDFGSLLEVPSVGENHQAYPDSAYPQGHYQTERSNQHQDPYSSDDGQGVVPDMDQQQVPKRQRVQ